jgi:hypothetical protein
MCAASSYRRKSELQDQSGRFFSLETNQEKAASLHQKTVGV